MPCRILAVWDTFPRPDFTAGEQRFVAMLSLLAASHRVDYVATAPIPEIRRAAGFEALKGSGVEVLGAGWSSFAKALSRRPYDLILFETHVPFGAHSGYVRERQPTAVLVIDSVDIHFAREAAGVALGLGTEERAAATRDEELAAYRAADAVIAVTDDERAVLQREGAMPPLFVVPIVVSTRARANRARAPIAVFVGGFAHQPNVDAVQWFVTEVWPEVHRAIPKSVFHIVGSNAPPAVTALSAVPGVRVMGYVPEIAPLLDDAAVSVAPLRYGAGMKGKVVDAMASGLPLVTTSFGVQGLPAVPGVHAEVTDRPDEFARAVIELLSEPETGRRMGAAAQALVDSCRPERVRQTLEAMVATLVPRHGGVNSRLRWLAANLGVAVRLAGRAAGFGPHTTPHAGG